MGFFISDHTTPNADARQKRSNLAFKNQGKSGFIPGRTSIFLFHCLICAHARVFSKATPREISTLEKEWTSEFSDTAHAKVASDAVAVPVLEKLGSAIADKEKGLLP